MSAKPWLVVLFVVIVAAVAILASSLHDVRFEPGRVLSSGKTSTPSIPLTTMVESIANIPFWKVMLFWALLAVNIALFLYLLPPALRKRLLRQILGFVITVGALLAALHYKLLQLPSLNPDADSSVNPNAATAQSNAQIPPFQPPQVTSWWMFLISFLVLAAVLTVAWLGYRWWVRNNGRHPSQLDLIEAIARSSLGDIAAGREWGNVIIQSYVRMSEAVSARRGLQRGQPMTPREFAERLEQAGLPAGPVHRLTRLFESARYGAKTASQTDVNEAVACLNSILRACGQTQ